MTAFVVSYVLAISLLGLGNTVGYHRLLTHRSFKATPGTRAFFTLLGALHGGSPILWVGIHRMHHAKSDGEGDPHTTNGGFWWAHTGWLAETKSTPLAILFALSGFGQQAQILIHDIARVRGKRPAVWQELCGDLKQEPLMNFLERPFVMPAIFLVQLGASWAVAGPVGILWLWMVHVLLTNSSWAVNSICHWPGFGAAPFPTGDNSRDVWWLSFVTNGESYHNGHHRHPKSAKHALKGGLDGSWNVIQLLCKLGLASDPWLPKNIR